MNDLKIIVSKEVAEFINKNYVKPNAQWILEDVVRDKVSGKETVYPELDSINYKDFLLAWTFGYTIEKSPEEQILDLYNQYLEDKNSGNYDRMPGGSAGVEVILDMLKILKLEVPGVNTKFE